MGRSALHFSCASPGARLQAGRTLTRLYRGSAHFLYFVYGVRLLADGKVADRDVILLVLAALLCIGLLYFWRRAPNKFGHDPEFAAQLLVHAVAIIGVVLATQAVARFLVDWTAVVSVAMTSALAAIALVSGRSQQAPEAPWKYIGMALASVSLMGVLASGILLFAGAAHG